MGKVTITAAVIVATALLNVKAVQARESGALEASLRLFSLDPYHSMQMIPPKSDHWGRPINVIESLFPGEKLFNREYVDLRLSARSKIKLVKMPESFVPEEPASIDRAENLVDNPTTMVKNIFEMDAKLKSAALKDVPWSDSYWPLYAGSLGNRYGDTQFPASSDWKTNHDYVIGKPAPKILATNKSADVFELSPSEKLDAVLGMNFQSLTNANWNSGSDYYDEYGSVEHWMGICHGWSPASYMFESPKKAVTVKAADGKTDVRFYPSDIKALASSLWAQSPPASRFVGGRCNEKNPKMDENGRVIDEDCFNTNPATWHMAVVNQIGVSQRGFVMDATFDYEVWNQPVYSYSYSYFNPQTLKASDRIENAIVSAQDYTVDKFKKYRSSKARKFVGVSMDVTYVVESFPAQEEVADLTPNTRTASYEYDLELDDQGLIIGGEWYTNQHPDFLWTPPKDAMALTSFDAGLNGKWTPTKAVVDSWKTAGMSAAKTGAPLSKLVQELIRLSQ